MIYIENRGTSDGVMNIATLPDQVEVGIHIDQYPSAQMCSQQLCILHWYWLPRRHRTLRFTVY